MTDVSNRAVAFLALVADAGDGLGVRNALQYWWLKFAHHVQPQKLDTTIRLRFPFHHFTMRSAASLRINSPTRNSFGRACGVHKIPMINRYRAHGGQGHQAYPGVNDEQTPESQSPKLEWHPTYQFCLLPCGADGKVPAFPPSQLYSDQVPGCACRLLCNVRFWYSPYIHYNCCVGGMDCSFPPCYPIAVTDRSGYACALSGLSAYSVLSICSCPLLSGYLCNLQRTSPIRRRLLLSHLLGSSVCSATQASTAPSSLAYLAHAMPLQITYASTRHGVIATGHRCREGMTGETERGVWVFISSASSPLPLHPVLNNNRARIN